MASGSCCCPDPGDASVAGQLPGHADPGLQGMLAYEQRVVVEARPRGEGDRPVLELELPECAQVPAVARRRERERHAAAGEVVGQERLVYPGAPGR